MSDRPRRRGLYAVLTAAVVVLGLASRSVGLPPFWAKYSGDALWALMVFLSLGFLLPSRPTAVVAALAAAFSCAVEFSQLYHRPWIDSLRATTLGHLALGDTFAWADMAAYLVGVATGAAAELALTPRGPHDRA